MLESEGIIDLACFFKMDAETSNIISIDSHIRDYVLYNPEVTYKDYREYNPSIYNIHKAEFYCQHFGVYSMLSYIVSSTQCAVLVPKKTLGVDSAISESQQNQILMSIEMTSELNKMNQRAYSKSIEVISNVYSLKEDGNIRDRLFSEPSVVEKASVKCFMLDVPSNIPKYRFENLKDTTISAMILKQG